MSAFGMTTEEFHKLYEKMFFTFHIVFSLFNKI